MERKLSEVKSGPVQHQSLEIEFKINCPITKPGETVRVTGSCDELGNWIPKDGLNLNTTASDFPIWKARTLIRVDGENTTTALDPRRPPP